MWPVVLKSLTLNRNSNPAPGLGLLLVPFLLLSGCAVIPPPAEEAYETVRPDTRPIRTFTSFTPALRCMDQLLANYYPNDGPFSSIISKGVINKTDKEIGRDNRDVLISTIGQMSKRSKLFRFVNIDPTNTTDLVVHSTLYGNLSGLQLPDYEIVAAITRFDENITVDSSGLGISLFDIDGGVARDQRVAVMTVDFNIAKPKSGVFEPGVTVSNTIAIVSRGAAVDLGGRFEKAGLAFNITLDRNQGAYSALRALIELSTLELLGQLAQVPYWRCLSIEQTNPEIQAQIRDWYDRLETEERVTFVQKVLKRTGYYRGPTHGRVDGETRRAIARYQGSVGLLPNGTVDFSLYRHIVSGELHERLEGLANGTLAAESVASEPAPPPLITIRTPRQRYRVGELLNLTLEVSQDSYLHCYYQDAGGKVLKLYPNRFQPNAYMTGRRPVALPGDGRYQLRFSGAGRERMLCLGSRDPIDEDLPAALEPDLTPLAVDDLAAVKQHYQALGAVGSQEAVLVITP